MYAELNKQLLDRVNIILARRSIRLRLDKQGILPTILCEYKNINMMY